MRDTRWFRVQRNEMFSKAISAVTIVSREGKVQRDATSVVGLTLSINVEVSTVRIGDQHGGRTGCRTGWKYLFRRAPPRCAALSRRLRSPAAAAAAVHRRYWRRRRADAGFHQSGAKTLNVTWTHLTCRRASMDKLTAIWIGISECLWDSVKIRRTRGNNSWYPVYSGPQKWWPLLPCISYGIRGHHFCGPLYKWPWYRADGFGPNMAFFSNFSSFLLSGNCPWTLYSPAMPFGNRKIYFRGSF